MVGNHPGMIDILMVIKHMRSALAARRDTFKVPFFGHLVACLGCVEVLREASEEARNEQVRLIGERQKLIYETGKYPPLCIFVEAGGHNNSSILSFKRGAFQSFLPIRPIAIDYTYSMFRPTYDVFGFFPQFIFHFCTFGTHCHIKRMPEFVPNDYLLKNHSDKVTRKAGDNRPVEQWEVFAWAIRDIISKASGLPKCDT